jgi:ankyrin repeat domain-containing protein 50
VQIVEPFSSSFTGSEQTQTINANHMSMCRFPSKDDEGYKQISGEIKILISEIQKRKIQDVVEKEREIVNLRTDSPSQTTRTSATYCM